MFSIEKAILLDVGLGVPLGSIVFQVPAAEMDGTVPSGPDTYFLRGEQLARMKWYAARGQADLRAAIDAVAQAAESVLHEGPFSVTDKGELGDGVEPHAYRSLAKYYWPADWPADKKDQPDAPYVRYDGQVNPACYEDRYDYKRLVRFSEVVSLLALAAYLKGEPRFAQRASHLLKTWFLAPETRQQPHFERAQAIPGTNEGRATGVVEGRFLVYALEAIQLLRTSGAISNKDLKGYQSWFGELLKWLRESDFGRQVRSSDNNIAFWYDLQCMAYAEFCDDKTIFQEVVEQAVLPRLQQQLDESGALPAELSRARPQDYVTFSVAAMAMISRLGERSEYALWDVEQGDGRNFQAAHDWLRRFAGERDAIDRLVSALGREPGESGTASQREHTTGMLLDLGLQLRAAERLLRLRSASLESLRSEFTALQQDRAGQEQERTELRTEVTRLTGELGKTEAARQNLEKQLAEREASRESERAYLQAQVDTAKAMWEHFRGQAEEEKRAAERAQKELKDLHNKLKQAEKRAQAVERKPDTRVDRRELEKLQQEFESERAYLQAQLDTANAMWAYYRSGGTPEQEGSAAVSLGPVSEATGNGPAEKIAATSGKPREKPAPPAGQNLRTAEKAARDLALYAERLEHKYAQLLRSRSWRLMGPARLTIRGVKRVILRRPAHPNRWPKRPEVMQRLRPRGGAAPIGPATRPNPTSARSPKPERDLRELNRYADELENKIRRLLASRSWKAMAPVRILGRGFKRFVLGKRVARTRLPTRPSDR